MRPVVDDVRYALRLMVRRPARALLTILILALGISATTAVFSVVDQTVLRPPPFLHGDRLVDVQNIRRGGGGGSGHSAEKVRAWRDQTSVFERLETYTPRMLPLAGPGEPERITTLEVSPGLFEMLGVQPALGRAFTAADAAPGAPPVVIVSARLADRRLGGRERALGRRLEADGVPRVVIGVMRDGFTLVGRDQAWTPADATFASGQQAGDFNVLARLPAGITVAEAQRRADQVADRMQAERPIRRTWDVRIDEKRIASATPATTRGLLAVLAGAVCLWLLACVGALQVALASVSDQQHDIRMRAALGASRWALVRLVLVQSMVLSTVAGVSGAVAAVWSVRLFAASLPPVLAFWRTAPLAVDGRVLAVTCVITAMAVLIAGLAPALWITRTGRGGGQLRSGGAATPRGVEPMSMALVATQVACAVVLAVGTTLMLRTVTNVGAIPSGFVPDGLVVMNVNLPVAQYPTPATQVAMTSRILDRLRGAPGVSSAAVAGGLRYWLFGGERLASSETELPEDALLTQNRVSDGYFETLGVRVLQGRTFTRADRGSDAVVVGRTLATRLWPSGRAVGATMRSLDSDDTWTVIGVVDDLDARISHDRPVAWQWYRPHDVGEAPVRDRAGVVTPRVLVRAASLEAAVTAVKAAVWAENPRVPIERVMRASDELRDVFATHLLVQRVATALAAIGLVVATVGVFGVLAHTVTRRRREIGVRMALGATPPRIARLVLGRAGRTLLAGVVLGLLMASALTQGLQAVLFGVTPLDPPSLLAAVATVVGAGLVAAWWPAHAAARVDPAVAIREE